MNKPMRDRIKIKRFYFICVDGIPMGSMFNMGSNGKRKIGFPYSAIGRHREREDAVTAKEKMIAYVDDVCEVPKHKRAGSAKNWD